MITWYELFSTHSLAIDQFFAKHRFDWSIDRTIIGCFPFKSNWMNANCLSLCLGINGQFIFISPVLFNSNCWPNNVNDEEIWSNILTSIQFESIQHSTLEDSLFGKVLANWFNGWKFVCIIFFFSLNTKLQIPSLFPSNTGLFVPVFIKCCCCFFLW